MASKTFSHFIDTSLTHTWNGAPRQERQLIHAAQMFKVTYENGGSASFLNDNSEYYVIKGTGWNGNNAYWYTLTASNAGSDLKNEITAHGKDIEKYINDEWGSSSSYAFESVPVYQDNTNHPLNTNEFIAQTKKVSDETFDASNGSTYTPFNALSRN